MSDGGLLKIFSHLVGCLFVLLTVLFYIEVSHLFIVSLTVCASRVIFRKWSPVSMH